MTTTKLHINSAISDVKSRYICMNVKDFYLKNQMDRGEYIMIQISMIPQEFLEEYNIAENHTMYIYIFKGNKGNVQTTPSRMGRR